MKTLYEGILGDIDTNIANMDKDLDKALNFPDKKDPMALKYHKNAAGGVRQYNWFCPHVCDNAAVKEFLIKHGAQYKDSGWDRTEVSIQIISNKLSGPLKNTVSIGFVCQGGRFINIGAKKEMLGSINKAVEYAYDVLCVIRDNPEMIEWLCKKWLKNYGGEVGARKMLSLIKCLETFDECMKKFKKIR